jgi:hypothetical protein
MKVAEVVGASWGKINGNEREEAAQTYETRDYMK